MVLSVEERVCRPGDEGRTEQITSFSRGTHAPTHYGKEVANNLAKELSQYGFTIVSGLAIIIHE